MVSEERLKHTTRDDLERSGTLRSQPTLAVEDMESWRSQSARTMLRIMSILGLLAVAGGVYTDYVTGKSENIPIYFVAYAIFLLLTFWRKVSYKVQVGTIIAVFSALSVFGYVDTGLTGVVGIMLVSCTVLGLLFFGRRVGIFIVGLSALSMLIFGWLFATGRLVIPNQLLIDTHLSISSWASTAVILLMLVLPMLISQSYLFDRFTRALSESRELTRQLETNRDELELRVDTRTQDLARRTRYLEATSVVAQEASAVLDDPQQLLSRVVDLISEQFGFYHAGIFLLDSTGAWAELQAASSEGGRRMLARQHRLRVGQEGTVGYVTRRGEARIALDVGEDAAFFDNPDLPETRSAMTLPLRSRGEIIGALDVQSRESGAFDDEGADILQALADQVALAISNARLFQQAQEAVEAERRAYGELSREAWQNLLRTESDLGFYSDSEETVVVGDVWHPEMRVALRTGQVTPGDDGTTLAIPVSVRGQVVGVIGGRKPSEAGTWTQDEIELLQALTEQVNVALEGARLYRDAQRRATRERIIADVGAHMRESLEMEMLLKTSADELRRALGLKDMIVRLVAADAVGDLG